MKIDCQEIRRVVRREGATPSSETPLAADLMRQKDFTDEEVDMLWELLEDDPSSEQPPDIGVREPVQPHGPFSSLGAENPREES
jgi:hypothetical protein